jgi:hypothetical protein
MKGITAFHGYKVKRDWSTRMIRTRKKKSKGYIGLGTDICFRCGKKYYKTQPAQMFCGSWIRKSGCSYLHKKESWKNYVKCKWYIRSQRKQAKKFRKKHPNYNKIYLKKWILNHPDYYRNYYKNVILKKFVKDKRENL